MQLINGNRTYEVKSVRGQTVVLLDTEYAARLYCRFITPDKPKVGDSINISGNWVDKLGKDSCDTFEVDSWNKI